jgi:hypothetical protein
LAELDAIARTLDLDWDDVLARAGLPKASKSRLKHGHAGRRTVERVTQALTAAAAAKGPEVALRLEAALAGTAAPQVERVVIVEDERQGRWYGRTNATDADVAARRSIRLSGYREIRGKIVSAASLSAHGPVDPLYTKAQSVGPLISSTILITGVAVVFDCTAEAVKAFAAFDAPKK